jgi:hypothetical protein
MNQGACALNRKSGDNDEKVSAKRHCQALAAALGDYRFVCTALQDGDNLAKYSPAV